MTQRRTVLTPAARSWPRTSRRKLSANPVPRASGTTQRYSNILAGRVAREPGDTHQAGRLPVAECDMPIAPT